MTAKQRIQGLDLARALAIFGMVIVNFKLVLTAETGNPFLLGFASLFEGRASALFVILAGVGIMLAYQARINKVAELAYRQMASSLCKRGLLLFVIGLAFSAIWPADILHFYGLYFIAAIGMLTLPARQLLLVATVLIFTYPILLSFFDYQQGWDFTTLDYKDFWTLAGLIRSSLFNGFHPVLPWLAFLLIGMALAQSNLTDNKKRRRLLLITLAIAFSCEGLSVLLFSNYQLLGFSQQDAEALLLTEVMPPTPLYMLAATSTAVVAICLSIEWSLWRQKSKFSLGLSNALQQTGQLSLTCYLLHVVLGMGIMEAFGLMAIANSIELALLFAVGFCLFCLIFSKLWLNFFSNGPFEGILKRLV